MSEPKGARAYDENGNVRPADARWLDDAKSQKPAEEPQDSAPAERRTRKK